MLFDRAPLWHGPGWRILIGQHHQVQEEWGRRQLLKVGVLGEGRPQDGYLFSMPNVNRRTLAEIEDGLIPALQDRGLMRKAYEHKHFRDNLLAY